MSNSSKEVAHLTKDLTQVKGKAKLAQLHQDNTIKGVKKLDEGQTVVCCVCHKEGHKSYECKVKNGGGAKKKEKKQTSKPTMGSNAFGCQRKSFPT